MLYCLHVTLINFIDRSCMQVRFCFYFALAMLFPINELVNCFLLETLAKLVLSHSLLL